MSKWVHFTNGFSKNSFFFSYTHFGKNLPKIHPDPLEQAEFCESGQYLQSHGDLNKPLHHLTFRQKLPFLLLELSVQITSFAEAHDDVQQTVPTLPGLLVGDNIGMLQLGQELGFLFSSSPLSAGGIS